jgi:hypothetical protein
MLAAIFGRVRDAVTVWATGMNVDIRLILLQDNFIWPVLICEVCRVALEFSPRHWLYLTDLL